MKYINKYVVFIIIIISCQIATSQQVEWLENDLFQIDENSQLLTNDKTGISYVMTSSVIPEGEDGHFEITNFQVNGINVNHPTVTPGTITLYIAPASITSFNPEAINEESHSIRLGYLFIDPEGFNSTNYKVRISSPGGLVLAESEDITPQYATKLRIEKIGNALSLKYEGDQDASKDISFGILDLPSTNYRFIIVVNQDEEGLSFNYDANGLDGDPTVIVPTASDPLNWIISRSYDPLGDLTTAGISYYDCLGRPTQSQSKDILTQKMWTNETRYDFQGRVALQSLSAPLNGTPQNFAYAENFIQNSNGNPISTSSLEANPELPPTIGTAQGTLGWYYSANNDSEPYQDATNRPYARTVYDELNPGNIRMVTGGKRLDTDGDGVLDKFPQGYEYTLPATQELYYAFGQDYFNGPTTDNGKEVILKSFKTVSIDPHGNEVVAFSDAEGRTLAAARSGGSTSYEVLSIIGEQGYVDVHIPKGITGATFLGTGYTVYDLRTGQTVSTTQVTGGNVYRIIHPDTGNGKTYITSGGGINHDTGARGVRYNVNYYDFSLNYYDKSGRLKETVQPLGFNAAEAFDLSTGSPSHNMVSTYAYNAIGELQNTTSPDEGTAEFVYRSDGQIRFSKNSKQDLEGEFSYTNYDERGRPVESGVCEGNVPPYFSSIEIITPAFSIEKNLVTESGSVSKTGASNWTDSGFSSAESTGTDDFNISFQFLMNTMGAVGVSQSNEDGNYTTIDYAMYFSKNKISIINNGSSLITAATTYDNNDILAIERTNGILSFIKNGISMYELPSTSEVNTTDFIIDGALYDQGASVSNIEIQQLGNPENVPPPVDGYTLNDEQCRERVFTVYDLRDEAGLEDIGIPTDPNIKGARVQRFVAGNVSKTYTLNPKTSTTWYSYDFYGRVEWMIQYIDGLGAKSIDYVYDEITGQVSRVIYQKYNSDERFVHKYLYNDAGQLIIVKTSRDNVNFTEHAEYTYYETGALKRVDLAEGLQGIDYVYTLGGRLKSINHPLLSSDYDPGGDQNDAFGFTLDYHRGDYTRYDTPLHWSFSGTDRYDGNIKGVRWQTQGLNGGQHAYMYEYNTNQWLESATYGSYSGAGQSFTPNSNEDYKVFNLQYDANGNIRNLNRNKSSINGDNDMDRLYYNYPVGSNRLRHVRDLASAVGDEGDIQDQYYYDNYIYNSIGQLIENKQDEIGYEYYASGLVKSVFSTEAGSQEKVEFFYNDRGHRVEKRVTHEAWNSTSTFYVRDAAGQAMAIYTPLPSIGTATANYAIEFPVYGLSRLGVADIDHVTTYELTDHLGNVRGVIQRQTDPVVILDESFDNNEITGTWSYGPANTIFGTSDEALKLKVPQGVENYSKVQFPVESGHTYSISFDLNLDETKNNIAYSVQLEDTDDSWTIIADENGEYTFSYTASSNGDAYLRFVLGTVYQNYPVNSYVLDDIRIVDVTNVGQAVMLAYKDYYPFGMPMPDRNIEGEYRYAYQGQEKDPETGMEAFELRLWDARIGRWLTTDPAGQYASPYLGMGNNPISRVDPDGGMDGDPSCCPGDCCPDGVLSELWDSFLSLFKPPSILNSEQEVVQSQETRQIVSDISKDISNRVDFLKASIRRELPDAVEVNVQIDIPLPTRNTIFTFGGSVFIDSNFDTGVNYNYGWSFSTTNSFDIGADITVFHNKNHFDPNGLHYIRFEGPEDNFDISFPTDLGFNVDAGVINSEAYYGSSLGISTFGATSASFSKTYGSRVYYILRPF